MTAMRIENLSRRRFIEGAAGPIGTWKPSVRPAPVAAAPIRNCRRLALGTLCLIASMAQTSIRRAASWTAARMRW